jgi:very-short-patch-repair endonuclease
MSNRKFNVAKRYAKSTKPVKKVDKEAEKIRTLIQGLDRGEIVPVRNFLRSLLTRVSKRTPESTKISEKYREENVKKASAAEIETLRILKELKIRFQFQQIVHHTKGKFFIMDFYIPSHKTALEVDGGYHDDEAQKVKDELRTKILNKMNIKVVRFKNEEVYETEIFKEKLTKLFGY